MEFAEQLAKHFMEITLELKAELDAEAEKIAEETADLLARTSPERTGVYGSGWTVEVTKALNNDTKIYTVHNKNKPGLTHLLNSGHATKNGGWVNGDGHFDKAKEYAIKRMEGKVGEVVAKNK